MRPIRHDMQIVFQDPYGSLSPRMSVSDIIEEGLWVHQPNLSEQEREQRVIRALTRCRARSGDALPLSARILRRPAPAHRGRARDRAGADLRRARRADQRARHADPGADRRSAARPAEAARPHLSVHLPRSARGGGAGEPAHRHAQRQGGGGGARGRALRQAARATIRARCSRPPSTSRPRPRASSPQ